MLEKHCEDDARHMARSPSDAALTSVAEVVGKMTSFLESIGDVDATLEQMCDNLVDAVPGADAAGMTVIRRGRPVTIVVPTGASELSTVLSTTPTRARAWRPRRPGRRSV
ncbi:MULTISPECIES: hypothetical protein [unclassified Rhodococcus (in: high G+C Gram-positive bacteria)]|uniref:hypothetical protein n=1 Tax=unclassified Rhodococcus (in: high G+C Gram-positive bacteria) TaxID=192944 RepID=UPI0021C151D9|nr:MULTISPECIES: hypothetical protein [unclassified Rhodococcus (in: high G+C Gram-positive bacteria)]